MILNLFFLLVLIDLVVTQSCTAYGTDSGTCKEIAQCSTAYVSTKQGATGCQSNPSPTNQCCTARTCTLSSGASGVCTNNAKPCSGTRQSSSQGANGCQKYASDVLCCGGGSSGPQPTPKAGPSPTPVPAAAPTPAPHGTVSCNYKGITGTCKRQFPCRAVSTPASQGATGCTRAAGVPDDHFCCTEPTCSFVDSSGATIQGKCTETRINCDVVRKTTAEGSTGCQPYLSDVTCCLSSMPQVAPTPMPGNVPCNFKSLTGTCKTQGACGQGLVSPIATGAQGCTSAAGAKSDEYCCTKPTCSFVDSSGQTIQGVCTDKEFTGCNTERRTKAAGAVGCGAYKASVSCCLDRIPATPMPTPRPAPTPPITPAPTPAIPQANGACMFYGQSGTCAIEEQCAGVHIPKSVVGVSGCGADTDASAGCCISKQCTVLRAAPLAPVNGNCRAGFRCNSEGKAAFNVANGGDGCQDFPVGNDCCVESSAVDTGGGGNPTGPVDVPTEFFCQIDIDGVTREGTCMAKEACGSSFHMRTEPTFLGCRNAAKFDHFGCCIVNVEPPKPAGSCTVGDNGTCRTGEECVMQGGESVCQPDPNFDCKAVGGCLVSGQECAADEQGNYRCGAPRSCVTLGCPRAGSTCRDVGNGFLACVEREDCFSIGCQAGEECRPDERGNQFPPQCAPASSVGDRTQNPNDVSPVASTVAGMELWLIALIIGISVCVCIVCCLIIAAIVVAMTRDDDQGPYQDTYNYNAPYNQGGTMGAGGTGGWNTGTELVRPGGAMTPVGGSVASGAYSQGGGYSFDSNAGGGTGSYGMGQGGGYTSEMGGSVGGAYPSAATPAGGYSGGGSVGGSYTSGAYPSAASKAAF